MFGSEMLEVGIGTTMLLLFVSLICTAAREALETVMKSRASQLQKGIAEFFRAPNGSIQGVDAFYNHALISPLFAGLYAVAVKTNLPTYIPAAQFAAAMFDLAQNGKLPTDSPIASAVENARRVVGDDAVRIRAELEGLYNGTMDRVSGWYKRRTQFILFGLGLTIAVVLNIDTVTVIEALSTNTTLRQAAVAEAGKAVTMPLLGCVDTAKCVEGGTFGQLRESIGDLGYPIGWPAKALQACVSKAGHPCPPAAWIYVKMAIGWLVTALAVTLGAPFWFDVLNKFIVIRSTVKPHEKSPEEGSEDRHDK